MAEQVVTPLDLGKGFALDLLAGKINVQPSGDAGNALVYGTDNLLYAEQIAASIPVPHVNVQRLNTFIPAMNPNGVSFVLDAYGADKIVVERLPMFTAMELSERLLKSDLRLELLVYTQNKKPGRATERGFMHPTHEGGTSVTGAAPIAPVLGNSRFRGGGRSNYLGATTEWSVSKNGQRFYVDALGQWLVRQPVAYRDVADNPQTLNMFVPTAKFSGGRIPVAFGYSRWLRPLYFQFRFSIADPMDRRQRITGPEGPVFIFAPTVHPFIESPKATNKYGRACNDLNPRFVDDRFNTWVNGYVQGN